MSNESSAIPKGMRFLGKSISSIQERWELKLRRARGVMRKNLFSLEEVEEDEEEDEGAVPITRESESAEGH